MTKRTRLIILLICAALFFVVAPYTILYSLGYRVDVQGRRIVATGGIYVRAIPTSADVAIGGEHNKTGIFSNSVFVQNLLPKDYAVAITKDGYFDYQKTLPVTGNEVTKLENVVLFKKEPVFATLTDATTFTTLKKTNVLYQSSLLNNLIGTTSQAIESAYPSATSFNISSDGQKVLYCNEHEVVYSLLNTLQEHVLLNRFSGQVQHCDWVNNDYVIFTVGKSIFISEIDTRGNINVVALPQQAEGQQH